MKWWPLLMACLLVAAAFGLARTLATRDGVGPVEYLASAMALLLLARGVLHFSHRALGRT
jgi:hypothetical protein